MSDRIDIGEILHDHLLDYWQEQVAHHAKRTERFRNRFERIADAALAKSKYNGDAIVESIKDVFENGLGIKWGPDQHKVFNAILFSALPLIYGEEWGENEARLLSEWKRKRKSPYTVVSMARRNGKTFVTAGTVVAMLLCIPRIKIAIFSTCKRTSQMMMSAAVEMLEKAFELGTHCNKQDFIQVAKNTEAVIFDGPDHTKRQLGCFPGSVRVSKS